MDSFHNKQKPTCAELMRKRSSLTFLKYYASIWVKNSLVAQYNPTAKTRTITVIHLISNIPDDVIITERSWLFKRGFLVSNGTMLVMHEIHSSSGHQIDVKVRLFRSNAIETFAVDSKSDMMYFITRYNSSLIQYDIISSQMRQLILISNGKGITLINISAHFLNKKRSSIAISLDPPPFP